LLRQLLIITMTWIESLQYFLLPLFTQGDVIHLHWVVVHHIWAVQLRISTLFHLFVNYSGRRNTATTATDEINTTTHMVSVLVSEGYTFSTYKYFSNFWQNFSSNNSLARRCTKCDIQIVIQIHILNFI
jgi:hypothetical protein